MWLLNGGSTVSFAKPVIELPGSTPTSPLMVFMGAAKVTCDPPKIAKLCAAPSDGGAAASAGAETKRNAAIPKLASKPG
jgi:hypothetical protein